MTLPAPNLDDRRFQQFVDDAKRYIQQRCPEWTDHNVSDPGVTLIEAVAHMVDQLVYRLNRVSDKHYLAFLDLLQITLLPPAAAYADITFWLSAPQDGLVLIPAGTEVATHRTERDEAVVFTTSHDLRVVPCELVGVVVQPVGRVPADRTAEVLEGKDTGCFAEPPRAGDTMSIGLSAAVPSNTVMLRLDSRVDGVGVDPRQPPLRWEAWTASGWRECAVAEDSTGGLNRPGEVVLHVPKGHVMSRIGAHEAGWLRCRVLEPEQGQPGYSVSPTIRAVQACNVGGTTGAVHAETIEEETLGESAGVPGQRFTTERAPVLAGDPPLVVECAADEGWQAWTVVEHFAASGPDDRHVRLDAATGEIAFGPAVRMPDGGLRQYGAVPRKGAVLRVRDYRIGGGRGGNVARGALCVLRSSIPYVARVDNGEAARGGVDGETLEEARRRAPITLRAQDRAVTARDYEELARHAAPEAARICCLPVDDAGVGAVRVLVVPQAVADSGGRLRFEQLVPGDELLARVTRHLDERRPIGVRLAVGPPFYQGITVVATLHAFGTAEAEQVRAAALDALFGYLDPLTGWADGRGWPFGRPLQAGEVFAVLQRVLGVELVDEVRLYPADPLTGRRGEETDRIDLTAAALVFSHDHKVRVLGGRG